MPHRSNDVAGSGMRIVGVAGLALLGLLSTPTAAAAQACGDWARPVLCEAQLVVTDGDGNRARIRDRDRLQIPPRSRLDVELEGRDQRGRRFPEDRVSLSYESSDCGRLLNIEDRGSRGVRLTARSDADRCRLTLWVPGNLNFEWELEFEVDPGARTSYGRREAEFIVDALYAAILNRAPDGGSQRSAVAEVQQGNLDDLVGSMLRSSEFSQSRNGVAPADLLDRFYRGMFNRPADSGGVREYLDEVQSRRYADVLLRMIRSPEFERRLPG